MPNTRVFPDADALADAAAERLVCLASDAIAERGRFSVALSGGSTPRAMYERLARPELAGRVDWARFHVFWGDERCVPPDHPDSNYRMAWDAWLKHVPLPAANIHRIAGEREPAEAAAAYDAELRAFFAPASAPAFDLVLLGLGDDGHTASLFPESAALHEGERWACAVYVEKRGTWRVTLTPPAINAAANILFLVSGASKAERLHEVLDGPRDPERLPAQIVAPVAGTLTWMVDAAAAARLPS